MKRINIAIAFISIVAAFASCKRTGPEIIPPAPSSTLRNIMVLNNGNWGSNDASVRQYNSQNKMVSECLFEKANGEKLGDLGQDILLLGEDYYVVMNGSKLIWVTDIQMNVQKSIKIVKDGVELAPRYLATDGVKIYASIFEYEGYVAEIDPVTYEYRLAPVGSYPEGIAIAGDKLYVVNSGYGIGNTMSVVDLKSFTKEKDIEVNHNPKSVIPNSKGNLLYICSYPYYGTWPDSVNTEKTLQVYDVENDILTTLDYKNVMDIAMSAGDILVLAISEDPYAKYPAAVLAVHDAANNKKIGDIVKTKIDKYYSLSADTFWGYIFVGQSDYATNGDVKVFSVNGAQLASFDSKGINPQKCICL